MPVSRFVCLPAFVTDVDRLDGFLFQCHLRVQQRVTMLSIGTFF